MVRRSSAWFGKKISRLCGRLYPGNLSHARTSRESPRGISSGVVEAISVRHFLRVCRWEGDSLLYLPYIPGSKKVAQSLVVICQVSPNLSVHLTGVPLRFTPAGYFIVRQHKSKLHQVHHEIKIGKKQTMNHDQLAGIIQQDRI